MTPYELNLIVEAYTEDMKEQIDEKLIMVWFGEYWHRQKKLPPLRKALEEARGKETKEMTDDEMLETVKKLNAMFGGTTVKDEQNERRLEPIKDEIDSV